MRVQASRVGSRLLTSLQRADAVKQTTSRHTFSSVLDVICWFQIYGYVILYGWYLSIEQR
jgi:hypothetical protein